MSERLQELMAANAQYAAQFGDKSKLAARPIRQFAILTCMDARLDPARFTGLSEGDAHVIRNAGGRASTDAIRSLVVSYKLLGTREWFVIQHTRCGMTTVTNDTMRRLLASSLQTAQFDGSQWHDPGPGPGPGPTEADNIDWLTFSDPTQTLIADLQTIRQHPLVPKDIVIHGLIYDVDSGKLSALS